jgi:hypothetical protein
MTESLKQPLANLRDALSAAERSAEAARAPSKLRALLARSVALLDGVLQTAALGPTAAFRLSGWLHTAVSEATEALLTWHAWVEAGRPPA